MHPPEGRSSPMTSLPCPKPFSGQSRGPGHSPGWPDRCPPPQPQIRLPALPTAGSTDIFPPPWTCHALISSSCAYCSLCLESLPFCPLHSPVCSSGALSSKKPSLIPSGPPVSALTTPGRHCLGMVPSPPLNCLSHCCIPYSSWHRAGHRGDFAECNRLFGVVSSINIY